MVRKERQFERHESSLVDIEQARDSDRIHRPDVRSRLDVHRCGGLPVGIGVNEQRVALVLDRVIIVHAVGIPALVLEYPL